jgi:hypothetical protein
MNYLAKATPTTAATKNNYEDEPQNDIADDSTKLA